METLGEIGDLEVETKALLVENQVVDNAAPFSKAAVKELPEHSAEKPWIIPKQEIQRRKDLRSEFVCSIDPIGCEDIDDTLSVKQLKNGNYEFGVHIADVNYFVKHNSVLDLEARKRATSIYLVDRRLDMLPTLLSADLCSLHQGVERLTVSVLWEITNDGEVVNTWFGESVIKSKYALHYEQAQAIIDNQPVQNIPPKGRWKQAVIAPEDMPALKKNLHLLHDYARIIRNQREKGGALNLESLDEVKIELSTTAEFQGKQPVKIKTKEDLEVHATVEEWMIFANHVCTINCYSHQSTGCCEKDL